MAFPVLSTYRLQMRGDCFTFADAEDLLHYLDDLGVSHLYLSPILTAVAGLHPRLRRHRSHHRVGRARRSRGAGPAVGGGAVARHGPDRRHRAQPPRRRQTRTEPVVVGRPASTAESSAFCLVLRHRLGRWTTAESCCRSGFRRRRRRPRGRRRRAAARRPGVSHRAGDRLGHPARGARPSALPADRLAQRGLRLPAVLLDHLAGRAASGGPRGVRRHPRRGQALVRRGPGRRRCASTTRTDCPIPQAIWRGCARSPDRDAWIVIEKILAVDEPLDPRLPVAGTTGYDALREIGGLFIDPAGAGPLTDLVESTGAAYDEMPELARELKAEAVTDTLGSELAPAAPRHRRRDGCRPPGPARRRRRAAQPRRTCTGPTT